LFSHTPPLHNNASNHDTNISHSLPLNCIASLSFALSYVPMHLLLFFTFFDYCYFSKWIFTVFMLSFMYVQSHKQ
jgi:hypothetical protein